MPTPTDAFQLSMKPGWQKRVTIFARDVAWGKSLDIFKYTEQMNKSIRMNHSQEGNFHHGKLCQAPSFVLKVQRGLLPSVETIQNYLKKFWFFHACGLNM